MCDLLRHTSRVTFELSTTCNLSHVHKDCPTHQWRDSPRFLPARIVYHVLDFMAADGFSREIAWHNYNEPTMDPRLFLFLDAARQRMPGVRQYILSNGVTMCQTLLDELAAHGVTRLWFTAYTDDVEKRLRALDHQAIAQWRIERRSTLDRRLAIYDRDKRPCDDVCFEPLENMLIRATGRVDLCCNDWRGDYTYGDLNSTSFEAILKSGKMQEVWQRLKIGDRFLPICKRCKSVRGTHLDTSG